MNKEAAWPSPPCVYVYTYLHRYVFSSGYTLLPLPRLTFRFCRSLLRIGRHPTYTYTHTSTFLLLKATILETKHHHHTTNIFKMASRFVENLTDIPISHPHLNVSLSDILAEETRKRSVSSSSTSSTTSSHSTSPTSSTTPTSPRPTSPGGLNRQNATRKRGFTLSGRKGRSGSS